jgi:hypothetical protein
MHLVGRESTISPFTFLLQEEEVPFELELIGLILFWLILHLEFCEEE